MKADILKRAGIFVIFVLAQAIVLGRIHLFHYATPLLYVWFVLSFERNHPKWAILLWSFFMGLFVDIFANTPGLAAASLTLIGAIQPYFLEPFIPRDSVDDLRPSIRAIGMVKYVYYITVLVVLYCIVFFSLEAFNFFNWMDILKSVGGSAVITLVLILTFESVSGK